MPRETNVCAARWTKFAEARSIVPRTSSASVIIDIEDDVYRDILIDKAAPLEDLHRGILAAFDFGEGKWRPFPVRRALGPRSRSSPDGHGHGRLGQPLPLHAHDPIGSVVAAVFGWSMSMTSSGCGASMSKSSAWRRKTRNFRCWRANRRGPRPVQQGGGPRNGRRSRAHP